MVPFERGFRRMKAPACAVAMQDSASAADQPHETAHTERPQDGLAANGETMNATRAGADFGQRPRRSLPVRLSAMRRRGGRGRPVIGEVQDVRKDSATGVRTVCRIEEFDRTWA